MVVLRAIVILEEKKKFTFRGLTSYVQVIVGLEIDRANLYCKWRELKYE